MAGERKIGSKLNLLESSTDLSIFSIKEVLEEVADVLFRYNFQTLAYDYISDSIFDIAGYTPNEIMASDPEWLTEKMHPDDRPAFLELFLACKNNTLKEDTFTRKFRSRHKDGHYLWISEQGRVIRDDNGSIIAIIGCSRDIGEQKRLLEELAASREWFKQISEATSEGICIHERGTILDASRQFCEMFGYTADELKGANCDELAAPQSRMLIKEHVEAKFEGPYESAGLRKNGSTFPIEVHAKDFTQNGKILRIATIKDLTEQKRQQQQLIDSEKKYRILYYNAKAALFRTRLSDGILLDCSRATAILLGYGGKEELLNHFSSTESYADPQQRERFIEALQKDKWVRGFQVQLKRKDGVTIWVSLTAEVFPEQDYIEGAMVDITPTKLLTRTEMEILTKILSGKSNKLIALRSGRSVRTIEDHRANVMRKLGVDNIVDLTRKALQYDITPDDE